MTKLNLGVPRAMGAMIISMWSMVIGGLVYILGGWYPKTRRGFIAAAFTDLLPVVKLSISSGFMLVMSNPQLFSLHTTLFPFWDGYSLLTLTRDHS